MNDAISGNKQDPKSRDVVHGELGQKLKDLEDLFEVDRQKLKQIAQRFGEELAEGLEEDGRNIPMNVTWVTGFPHGHEKGSFLTLDLGGTNLRVCWVSLTGERGGVDLKQEQYTIEESLKSGEAETLWNLVTDTLQTFIQDQKLGGTEEEPLPLSFTFSYPATQHSIDHGVLQRWTKGWDVKGVEGEDAANQLRKAIAKKNLPIRLVCLVNDTTGAMIASAYNDPETIIGAIFGTGCNAAYMEDTSSIPKLSHKPTKSVPMAINCEYGAFDSSLRVLPQTRYDAQIDAESPRPGQQRFEKLSAGLYLGEIFRLVLLDLHSQSIVFKGQDASKLEKAYALDTGDLSRVEDDVSPDSTDIQALFKDSLGIDISSQECLFAHHLAIAIAVRAARLCACGVAAIVRRKGITTGHVAADGSVANKHPRFKERWAGALGEILDWDEGRKDDPITLTSAEDGSGVGAAVIAAMTVERRQMSENKG